MVAILSSVAVAACLLALLVRRAGGGRIVVATMAGITAALAIAAYVLRPAAVPADTEAPGSWLVVSAKAFNGPILPTLQGANGAATVAGALPELADRLAARLEQSPDDPDGWSLLATTYRQLGREPEALAAQQRAIEVGAGPEAIGKAHQFAMAAPGRGAMNTRPAGAEFVIEGQRLRVQRKFQEAAEQFRKAVEADPLDADSWADLADCAAAAAGRNLIAGRDALQQALAINPQHRKALWLRASLEMQELNYAAAVGTWRTLASLVAADSPDARVIAANMTEAETLAAGAGKGG